MATSSPAYGIADKRVFIPAADATDTAPTGTSAPVLSTAPDRNPSALRQAADNAGQQNPPPMTSQPVLLPGYNGTPPSPTPHNALQNVYPPKTGRESDSQAADDTDTDAATSRNDVGLLPQHDGNNEQDLEYCLKQLAIGEEVLGTNHASIATLHNNIGLLLNGQGKHEQAMQHYLNALAIKEKIFGNDHLSTAITYGNIGSLLHDQGKHEEAMNYYPLALNIEEKVLGTAHASTAASYGNIALLLRAQGRHVQTLEYFSRALASAFASNRADTAI